MLDYATMCCMELEQAGDWRLVGAVIRGEIARRGLTLARAAELAGRDRNLVASRLEKGKRPDPDSLRRYEGVLGLPRDLLSYVAAHDLDRIKRTAADPDLVTWLTNEISAAEDRTA